MRARAASIRRWALLTLTLTAALTLPGTLPAGEDAFQALALTRVNPPAATKDFTAPAPGGGQVRLASYRGKVVLLNFWASW